MKYLIGYLSDIILFVGINKNGHEALFLVMSFRPLISVLSDSLLWNFGITKRHPLPSAHGIKSRVWYSFLSFVSNCYLQSTLSTSFGLSLDHHRIFVCYMQTLIHWSVVTSVGRRSVAAPLHGAVQRPAHSSKRKNICLTSDACVVTASATYLAIFPVKQKWLFSVLVLFNWTFINVRTTVRAAVTKTISRYNEWEWYECWVCLMERESRVECGIGSCVCLGTFPRTRRRRVSARHGTSSTNDLALVFAWESSCRGPASLLVLARSLAGSPRPCAQRYEAWKSIRLSRGETRVCCAVE